VRIAVLGAGEMGTAHAIAYAGFGKKEGVEIAGIVSRRAARARELARRVGAPALTDPMAVLDDDSVDAVDVVVPSGNHREYVVAALERGKHVFVETPMALTLPDADAMVRAARAHRRVLMVAQVMRCVASRIRFHEAAASREMGRPTAVVASRLAQPYWKGKHRPFRLYGDPVVELSIHDFDLANWILGRPAAVSCSGVAGRDGVADHTFAWVEYRGGGYALVEACARMPPGFPFTTAVRVQFEAGVLDHAGSFTGGPIPEERFVRSRKGRWEPVRVRGQDPYEEECRHFVRAVRGKADPGVLSPLAERAALRVALAARESLRTGRRVPLR
jgi:predicted dehydrogenase